MPDALLPPGDFDDIINIRIVRLAAKLSLAFQREALRPVGLTLQEWRVIISLARSGDRHLREVSRLAELDASHASRVTQQLEEKNLIRRFGDPDDSRKITLSLTENGQALFFDIWPKAQDLSYRLKNAAGEQAFEQLKGTLDNMMTYADAILGD